MAATPIYETLGCPICAERQRKTDPETGKEFSVCADCGARIPVEDEDLKYRHMQGFGFQSHTSDHRHTEKVEGIVGFEFAKRELCRACYLKDFAKVYPDAPAPRV